MELFLFLLAGAGAVGFVVWNFRRKAAARDAASKARFERMLSVSPPAAAGGDAAPAPVSAPTPAAAPAPLRAAAAASLPARERFLGQPETLVYYLLKSGLPGHEIFANVSLASLVGVAGANEQQLRRLAPYRLDFVVCDKSMRIVAAIDVDVPVAAAAAGEQQFKVDCLKQAGIRLLRVNPAALPKREQIRELVGAAGSA